jgi:LysM repeat protein
MCKFKVINALFACLVCLSFSMQPQTPVFAQDIPDQAYVSGLIGHPQTYALSCESRSAVDLAQFWGINISEVTFFNNLPSSDNPDVGFVGSVHGSWGQIPPNPYGVHAPPIANLLLQYSLNANALRGMSWDDLRREIAGGRPVIVWIIGGIWTGTPITYHARDGSSTIVAAYEHTMILIGYDQDYVHLVDSANGYTLTHKVGNFLNSWSVLGNMAVTAQGEKPKPPPNIGGTYTVKPGDFLIRIANQFNVSWQDLAVLNNITYPYIIYPGQVLSLPGNPIPPEPSPTLTSTSLVNGTNTPTIEITPEPTFTPSHSPTPTEQAKTSTPEATENPTPTLTRFPTETLQPTASPQPTQTPNLETYLVKRGDYLMKIARELNLQWREIASLNNLAYPYVLFPGQQLYLPSSGGSTTPIPTSTAISLTPTPQPTSTGNIPETYTVQRGDYLVEIARQFGIKWQALAALNNIPYPYIILPGQELKLP